MKSLLIFGLLIVQCNFVFGQQGKAALSQYDLKIGEAFTLTYALPIPSTSKQPKVIFTPERAYLTTVKSKSNGSAQSIEVRSTFKDTLMDLEDGRYWVGVYDLVCWDSGQFVIAGPTLQLNGSPNKLPEVKFNCNLLPHQSNVELYDIKESEKRKGIGK